MLLNFRTAALAIVAVLIPLSGFADTSPNQELDKAQVILGGLRKYVNLDEIASAVEAIDSAQKAVEATPKGSPDYAQKLAALKKAIDQSRSTLETSVKRNLSSANEKSADELLKRLDWNYAGFSKCVTYAQELATATSTAAQGSVREDVEQCRQRFAQARKNIDKYIQEQDRTLVAQDEKLKELESKYQSETEEKLKKQLEQEINKLKSEREKTRENKKTAESLKKSLSFGDFLLALAEIIAGVVTLVSCETGAGCVAAVAMIAAGVDKLSGSKDDVQQDNQADPQGNAGPPGAPAKDEAALKEAATKAPADPAVIEKYRKDNPTADVVPTDNTGPFILVQKVDNGIVKELSIISAETKNPVVVIQDDSLFVDAKSGKLALLTGFKKFTGASTKLADDKSAEVMELRGYRVDGNAGSILLRLFPFNAGKMSASGA